MSEMKQNDEAVGLPDEETPLWRAVVRYEDATDAALAWVRLIEMRGILEFNRLMGKWVAHAPTGSRQPGLLVPRLFTVVDESSREAVSRLWGLWCTAGRPRWPKEIREGDEGGAR